MASKLRIAVWYNLPSGGAKRALSDHIKGLVARGHTVEAWSPPLPQAEYLPIGSLVPEHIVPFEAIGDGHSYADRIARYLVRQSRMRASMRRHSEIAGEQISKGGFDVLFANTCLHYHSPWIGRYVSIPKLLYLAEPKRPFYEAMPRLPWPALPEEIRHSWRFKAVKKRIKDTLDIRQNRLQAADELQNALTYDRILCNSNYSRESILRAYNLEARICYLGIDADLFADQGRAREPFVISVGTFGPSKNPEFIIRAIGTIPEPRPKLIWVANMADPVYLPAMESLANELGVSLDVRRYIPDDELLGLLNRATAMAYAPRLEPFGYAPLEANACGCPAVVVSEGGVKESVQNGVNGVVVPPRPAAMGAAIADLLRQPDEAAALGRRAAEHVRTVWSLERATDELEQNLYDVLH